MQPTKSPPASVIVINAIPISWLLAGVFAAAAVVEAFGDSRVPKTLDCAVAALSAAAIGLLARAGKQELAANALALLVAFIVNWLLWNSVSGSFNIIGWALPSAVVFSVLTCRRWLAVALSVAHVVSFSALMWRDGQPGAFAYALFPSVQYDRVIYGFFILTVTHLVCDMLIRHVAESRARERKLIDELVELNHSLEARVAERTKELARLNNDLHIANRELEAFSYSVAHDLRSPLNAISGFTQLVAKHESGRLGERSQYFLGMVTTATNHMAGLIDAILALSRLSYAPLVPVQLNLSTLAEEVAAPLRTSGEFRRAEIVIEPGMLASGDAALVRALLQNLIGNALKYSAKVEQPRVTVGSRAGTSPKEYFVADNGAGFDPEQAGRLFRPFQRLHAAAEFPGTGVGLASVRRIAERHGGRVWADSRPAAGATFWFTLAPSESDLEPSESPVKPQAGEPNEAVRIE